jgi:O-antigen/teichoic acid export membrane protein
LKAKSLIENSIWGASGELIVRLIKFIQLIVIANFLGTEGMGLFNYAIAAAGLFSIFFDFGILTVATRENSKRRTPNNLLIYFITKIITSGIGFLLFIGAYLGGFYITESADSIVYLVASILILDISHLILAYYRAQHNFQKEAQYRAAIIIIQFIGTVVILNYSSNLTHLAISLLCINLLSMYPLIIILITDFKKNISRVSLIQIKSTLKECLPFAGIALVGALYTSLDVLILGHYLDISLVGIYTIAMKFILGFMIIPIVFIQNAQIPAMASSLKNMSFDLEDIKQWQQGFFKIIFIGLAIGIFFAAMSDLIIDFTFGENFKDSSKWLTYLTIVGLCYYIYTPFITYLIVTGNAKLVFYVQLTASLLNLLLLLLLVPQYGIIGAVISSIITHTIIGLLIIAITLRIKPNLLPMKQMINLLKYFLSFVVVILSMFFLDGEMDSSIVVIKLTIGFVFFVVFYKESTDLIMDIYKFVFKKSDIDVN